MARYYLIVAQDQADLYDYLRRKFAGDEEVLVLLDRRWGEQRQHHPERRRSDRGSVGVIVVVKQEGVSPG